MSDTGRPLPTSELWEQLVKAASVGEFIEQNEGEMGLPPFCEYISDLCRQRGEPPERVIKRAHIERTFGHALFRGDRNPSRDTVLQLAFGFGADVEMTGALLRHAGHSQLYPRVPRDTAIAYCIIHGTDYIGTQQVLMELGLPLLGGVKK